LKQKDLNFRKVLRRAGMISDVGGVEGSSIKGKIVRLHKEYGCLNIAKLA
jgi:hypothetical protein